MISFELNYKLIDIEMESQPVPTLYCKNLNDKIKVEGNSYSNPIAAEMRVSLFHLFSTYGEVMQVRMR